MKKLLEAILIVLLTGSMSHGFEPIKNENDAVTKEAGIIYLVGEVHNNEADIKQKELLTSLAIQGGILLALEGEDVDSSQTLFGLEEVKINSVAGSLTSLMNFFTHVLYKKTIATFASSVDGKNVINKKVYSKVLNNPRYMLDSNLKLIHSYILTAVQERRDTKETAFFKSQSKSKLVEILRKTRFQIAPIMSYIGKNSFDDNFYDNMSNKPKEWYTLFKRIAIYWHNESAVSSIVPKEAIVKIKNAIAELDNLYSLIENAKTDSELLEIIAKLTHINKEVIKLVTLDLRNEIFLKKICVIYESTQDLDKPFFVVVGANHIPFLKEKLAERGYCVQVNNRATELLYKSDL